MQAKDLIKMRVSFADGIDEGRFESDEESADNRMSKFTDTLKLASGQHID